MNRTSCLLVDTRPAPETVGTRAVPIGVDDTFVAQVTGTNGNCTIPAAATAVSLNVTVIGPTAASFLTVFPSDKARPLTANLNWVANQTPNAVTVALSADGKVGFYNLSGSVNVTVDVVGFYELSSSGPPGPAGPAGVAGTNGVTPARVVRVATSGGDFTSVRAALASITDSGQDVTVITCACGSATAPVTDGSSATLRASGAGLTVEVRSLTIANTGGNTFSVGTRISGTAARQVSLLQVTSTATGGSANNLGVGIRSSTSPLLTDVVATATGGTSNNGVSISLSSPLMTGVTATGTGGTSTTTGMFNTFSTTTINNLTTTASGGGGVNNLGMQNVNTSTTTIRNSVITGASFSIIQNATGTVRMTGSTLQPGTVSAAGTFVGEFNVDGSGGPIIC